MWRERSVWEAGDDAGDARGGAGAVGAVHGARLTQPHHVHRGGVAELPLAADLPLGAWENLDATGGEKYR